MQSRSLDELRKLLECFIVASETNASVLAWKTSQLDEDLVARLFEEIKENTRLSEVRLA